MGDRIRDIAKSVGVEVGKGRDSHDREKPGSGRQVLGMACGVVLVALVAWALWTERSVMPGVDGWWPREGATVGPGGGRDEAGDVARVSWTGDLPSEWADGLDVLCAESRRSDPSLIAASVGGGLWSWLRGESQADVESALGDLVRFCDTVGEGRVLERFERRIRDIEKRVARIAEDACGPRFAVNWSYHVSRIRNGNGLERYDYVARRIERALTYYEDLARDVCAFKADMNRTLGDLEKRWNYDRGMDALAEGLKALRGHGRLGDDEACRVASYDGDDTSFWHLNNGCPRLYWLFDAEDPEGNPKSYGSTWALFDDGKMTGFDENLPTDRGLPYAVYISTTVDDFLWPELQKLITRVCVDRLTRSREVGKRLFVEAQPEWSTMDESRRKHYREIFDRMVDGHGGSVGIDAVARCADKDYRNLGAVVERIVDEKYEEDLKAANEHFVARFEEQYGEFNYVGRGLQRAIYLQRIYELEYELTPDDLENPSGPVEQDEVRDELKEEYRAARDKAEERKHELVMADLNAKTQIETARIQAQTQLDVAREEAQAQLDVARINQDTEMKKIRANRKGFVAKVLSAAAPTLGSGVVEEVLSNVFFPAQTVGKSQ